MAKKSLTFIQLMLVVMIMGIIATLAISNLPKAQEAAKRSAFNSDKCVVQDSLDRYRLEKEEYPTTTVPTVDKPAVVEWAKLDGKYLTNLPKDRAIKYYWVDVFGTLWSSDIDSPKNTTVGGTTITINGVAGAKSYKVGYVDMTTLSSMSRQDINAGSGYVWIGEVNHGATIQFSHNTVSTIDGVNKKLVISAVSKNGEESVPVGLNYIGS